MSLVAARYVYVSQNGCPMSRKPVVPEARARGTLSDGNSFNRNFLGFERLFPATFYGFGRITGEGTSVMIGEISARSGTFRTNIFKFFTCIRTITKTREFRIFGSKRPNFSGDIQ